MGQIDKRSITLSSELATAVDEAVAAGEYASASEVVRDALRRWKERRDLFGYTVEELRALWDKGIASGEPKPGPPVMEKLLASMRRWRNFRKAKSDLLSAGLHGKRDLTAEHLED